MFNLFKKKTEQTSSDTAATPSQFKNAADNNSVIEPEKKKTHGQDGVCCGSCGGE